MDITYQHPEYRANLPAWEMDEDFYLGDLKVKAGGVKYLPRITTDQEDTDYEAYKERGLYFGSVGRTVNGLTGSALLKEPSSNLTGSLEYFIKTQDVKETIKEVIKIGRNGLFVDMPAETQPKSVMEVKISLYRAIQITNWEEDDTGKLTRVVLLESVEEQDEDGNVVSVPRYRELKLDDDGKYEVNIYEPDTDSDSKTTWSITETYYPNSKGTRLDFIPFVFINPIAVSTTIEVSPIQDLVSVAKSHYQTFADYKHALHFTALPTGYATGVSKEEAGKIKLGSQTFLTSNNDQAKFGMLEFEGKGLEELVVALAMMQQYMVYLGARLFEDPKKGVESAETHRLKQGAETATLSSIVDATESGYRVAIAYANVFLGTTFDPETSFSMSRDFIDSKMTPEELTAIMNDWINGGMSYETYYSLKEQGELTRAGITAEQEQDQIESEGPTMNITGV